MLTKSDKILIIGLITIASLLLVVSLFISNEGSKALIKVGKAPIQKVSLMVNRKIDFEGENGEVAIEVREGRVRVAESSCPQKICVKTGWIDKPGQSIICFPNKVLVAIEAKKTLQTDGVTY